MNALLWPAVFVITLTLFVAVWIVVDHFNEPRLPGAYVAFSLLALATLAAPWVVGALWITGLIR